MKDVKEKAKKFMKEHKIVTAVAATTLACLGLRAAYIKGCRNGWGYCVKWFDEHCDTDLLNKMKDYAIKHPDDLVRIG